MTNFVQLQEDIWYALLSRQELIGVNVVQFRKMQIQSEIDMKLVYLTTRNNCSGAGIVVEMPTMSVRKPDVSGPVLEVEFPILVMEQPTLNIGPGGTLLQAEEITLYIMETLHHLSLGQGSLRAMPNAITPATEYRGVIAYRCHLGFTSATAPTPRTGNLQYSFAGDSVSLSCSADPTATIRYTLDGSWPASVNGGNVNSNTYANGNPVSAASGTIMRACAYATGKLGSSVTNITFP